VKQYLLDLNATQAAIRAGYSVHTAKEIGYQNLQKPHVAMAVDSALAKFGGITRTRLLEELGLIAFADIGNVVSWNETAHATGPEGSALVNGENARPSAEGVTKIRPKVTILPSATMDPRVRRAISKLVMTDNGGLRIEMPDKLAALDKLARALGMYTERDLDHKSVPFAAVTIYEGRPATWLAPGEVADNPRGGSAKDGD
jgi:Terminase small subunit